MKITIFILFSLTIAFSATIVLQVDLPLANVSSSVGLSQVNAIKLAHSLFGSYKGYNIELKIEDISKNPILKSKDIAKSNAIAVVGYPNSSYALKDVNILEKAEIPVILTTATNSILTQNKDYIHMVLPSDKMEAKEISKFIIKNFVNPKIAFVYQNDEIYTKGLTSKIFNYLKESKFKYKQKNFFVKYNLSRYTVAELTYSIVDYNPDLILFSLSPDFYYVVNLLLKKGYNKSILLASSFDDELFYKKLQPSKKASIYISSIRIDKKQSLYKEFCENYKDKFRSDVDIYSLFAYNSYLIFFNALKYLIDNDYDVNRENFNLSLKDLNKVKLVGGIDDFKSDNEEGFFSYKIFKVMKTNNNYSLYLYNGGR
jgi:ABC-type branched-subunit amino acid transport system substrate-binding protein